MYKIGVVGDKDSILGFTTLGMDVFPAYTAEDIKNTITKLADSKYGIIYITENASLLIEDYIDKYKERQLPAIIIIPGNTGSMKIGSQKVKEAVKKAVGIDIVFKEEEKEEEGE